MGIEINDTFSRVRKAREEYEQALTLEDVYERHAMLRLAYADLSQAASDAYMYYSAKNETNIFSEGGLSTWAREELGQITKTLSAQYHQQGLTSTQRMVDEFDLWEARVCEFVNKLAAARRLEAGQSEAKDWKEEEIRRAKKRHEQFEKSPFSREGVWGM